MTHELPSPTRQPSRAPRVLARLPRRLPAGSAVGLSLLLASCGDGGQVEVYPVSGTVKFGKEVPSGAQVVLHPQGHALPQDAVAMGTVRPDGTFKIGTYDAEDGAPEGEYKATIQWFKVVKSDGGVGRGPNVLPKSYSDPAKSPVIVKVAGGATELPAIEIKR